TEPANEFYFGIIDLIFHAPAVILEHSSHIDKIEYTHNKLVIEFGSTYARDLAKESWPEGTIIVSNTADCKASSDDDQCYFKVNEVINADEEDAIIVFGNPQTRDESTKGGEARWGRYKPDKNGFGNGKQPNGVSSCHGSPSSCPNSGKYNQANSASAGIPEASTEAPPDTKYHLPTACTGSYFDLDLDEAIGVGVLSDDYLAFLQEASNDLSSDSHSKLSRRVSKFHRRGWGWWNKIWNAVKKHVIEPVVNVVKKVYKYGSAVVKGSFNFALPDGNKASIKQVDSPWGPAALIAAYGTQSKIKADKGVQYEAYLNIYCVGCAAQGRIELAGSATWDVRKGITKGEIEVWADLKVAMKVGIDAQIKLTREWKKQLFQRGLPSLDFGFIIIGPTIRVDARVALEAGAEGRILAGAEMNWNRAYAKVDFIDPSKSTRRNFDPIGHPILEAEGSIYVGAELGLPIGLHFGITIAHWSKAVGLIDEPMIKGIAKAAARAELADGKITAGFTLTEGCKGIHASLSLRNKLVCDVLDIKEFTILDTDYKSIASMCIPIGKQTKSTADNGEISKITDDERTKSSEATDAGVNYGFPNVEDDPYKRTDGYVFTKLLAGSYNVMYCSNGNMYLKYITQQADLGCDDLFAYNDDAVVGDGQGRYFYYHDDSMNAAGVSRLRLGVEESPIEGTSAVAMVPWRASATGTEPDAEVEGLYVIADFVKEDIYYMTFCTYKDQQRPKIYVVSNITSGIDVLESGDVKFSVTGGDVDRCYPLTAKEDAEEQDKWAEWDTSLDTDANGLEFELPDESNSPAA
ncbi:hypothetical protein T440DRAFT_410610, partial [Plenodomus tracheiphilus IPT5]